MVEDYLMNDKDFSIFSFNFQRTEWNRLWQLGSRQRQLAEVNERFQTSWGRDGSS